MNDVPTVLVVDDLTVTLKTDINDEIPFVYKSQTILILQRHLDQTLRLQYITVHDPTTLWRLLHARFNH